jgi:hypothetical protein
MNIDPFDYCLISSLVRSRVVDFSFLSTISLVAW